MVYPLLYYDYNDKVLVENYLRANGKDYYIHYISPVVYEYIKTLPKVHYNEAIYSKEEHIMLEMFELDYDKYLTAEWISDAVIDFINSDYAEHKVKNNIKYSKLFYLG